MLLAVGRLFNLNSRPPFFYREDAAIPACVEHMWAGRIAPLRPRRTASYICCIWGNPAPLTGRKREDSGTNPESAERTPPWNASESARVATRYTEWSQTRSYDTPTARMRAAWGWTVPLSAAPERELDRRSGGHISDLKFAFAGPLGTHHHRCVASGPFLFALLKFCPPLLCLRL